MKLPEHLLESIVLLTIFIKSVSYIPFIFSIEQTEYTRNIPYLTLFMDLLAALLLCIVSLYKNYIPQLLLFLIYFLSVFTVVLLKIKYDSKPCN